MTLKLQVVEHDAALYDAIVALRYRVLRAPLGIAREAMDLSGDAACIYVVALEDAAVVGVVALDLSSHRLRQMAVEPAHHKRGIGRRLVACLEEEARTRGLTKITLHARGIARGFYAKLGYSPVGEPFTEVGIPHIAMEKALA